MPAKPLMSWEPKSRRWWKQYQGHRYVVSCRQLNAPPTKEGSYKQANEWWRAKLTEIGAQQEMETPAHPHQDILDHLDRRIAWAQAHGLEHVQANAEVSRYMVEASSDRPTEDIVPLLEMNTGDVESWSEIVGDNIPKEQTLAGLSTKFLELSEARVMTGELSGSECDLAHRCVAHFVEWIGGSKPPDIIDAERWEGYWKHLLKLISEGNRSREYVKKDWRYARGFIEWLASMGKMTLPPNLHQRRYRFGTDDRQIPTFTVEECKRLVERAPGQLRLHLLLMLNCGMYQGDISELRHEEVDLEAGRITRQRSKVRKRDRSATTVSYRLWPISLELMRQHRSDHPELFLVNGTGKRWVEEVVEGGRRKYRRDGIMSNFRHIQKATGIDKPLKLFRKTSASRLEKHREYGRYAQYFLAHKPRSVVERHYVVPDQAQFDDAVDWLRTQYGF